MGVVEFGDKKIMAISPQSPIGQAIAGKEAGETFDFRGKMQRIFTIK